MANFDAIIRLLINGKPAKKSVREVKNEVQGLEGTATKANQRMEESNNKLASSWQAVGLRIAAVGYAMNEIAQSASKLDGLKTRLEVIFGNAEKANEVFEELRLTADKLGTNFQQMLEGYSKFTAATKGGIMSLEESNQIFLKFTRATSALKLSADQTERVFRALEQMISKGNVQAEELRGQLGENMPGAFKMAADAIGVTQKELNKMLDQGQVAADVLLPRLADVVEREFGSKWEKSADSVAAALHRVSNAVIKLKEVAIQLLETSGIIKGVQKVTEGLALSMETIYLIGMKIKRELTFDDTVNGLRDIENQSNKVRESFMSWFGIADGFDLAIMIEKIKASLNDLVHYVVIWGNELGNTIYSTIEQSIKGIGYAFETLWVEIKYGWLNAFDSMGRDISSTFEKTILGIRKKWAQARIYLPGFDTSEAEADIEKINKKIAELSAPTAYANVELFEKAEKEKNDIREKYSKKTENIFSREVESQKKQLEESQKIHEEKIKMLEMEQKNYNDQLKAKQELDKHLSETDSIKKYFNTMKEEINQTLISTEKLNKEFEKLGNFTPQSSILNRPTETKPAKGTMFTVKPGAYTTDINGGMGSSTSGGTGGSGSYSYGNRKDAASKFYDWEDRIILTRMEQKKKQLDQEYMWFQRNIEDKKILKRAEAAYYKELEKLNKEEKDLLNKKQQEKEQQLLDYYIQAYATQYEKEIILATEKYNKLLELHGENEEAKLEITEAYNKQINDIIEESNKETKSGLKDVEKQAIFTWDNIFNALEDKVSAKNSSLMNFGSMVFSLFGGGEAFGSFVGNSLGVGGVSKDGGPGSTWNSNYGTGMFKTHHSGHIPTHHSGSFRSDERLAKLQVGESVINRAGTNNNRDILGRINRGEVITEGGGETVNSVVNVNVSAMDAQSFQAMLAKDGGKVIESVVNKSLNNNGSVRRKITNKGK